MNGSRTKNSIRNAFAAAGTQVSITFVEFIVRSVFIYTLGKTYLGLSGLFSDILTILSLAELGFGVAITYALYVPVAKDDKEKVTALINLFARIYRVIGAFISIAGLCLTPFLNFFISDMPDIDILPVIYILYLFNTSLSYFLVYKKNLLNAYQKANIVSLAQITAAMIKYSLQIITLFIFKNYILYLVIQLVCTLLENIIVSVYVDRNYKFLKDYKGAKVSKEQKKEIFKNVRAMFLSKISSAVVTSTDNILISKFVSTITLGFYSNYTFFTNFIRGIMNKMFEAIYGSVGNLLAAENSEKAYLNFKRIWFINFYMISTFSIIFITVINPFITVWLGESYLLQWGLVFFICFNMYMRYIRNTCLTFIDTYGLFTKFRLKCVAEALINLVTSILYLKALDMGITGVLLGTFTSNILTNFWYEPYVLYKYQFKKPLRNYMIRFVYYLTAVSVTGGITVVISHLLFVNVMNVGNIWNIVLRLLLCLFVIPILYKIIFGRTDEYKYIKKCLFKKENKC